MNWKSVASFFAGLVVSVAFTHYCNKDRCVIVKNDLENKVFKKDGECYTLEKKESECDEEK